MKGVPGFETEDSKGKRYQSHSLQKDEHQDGDDDLLQFGFARFDSIAAATFIGELDVDVQFFVFEVSGADGDFSSTDWQFESDIVRLQVALDGVDEITRGSTSCQIITVVIVANYFNGFGYLNKKKTI